MTLQLSLNLLLELPGPQDAPSAVGSGVRDMRDFYPTPFGLIANALDLVIDSPLRVLDPCAGTGRWGVEAHERWPDAQIHGVDLFFPRKADGYSSWEHRDFLGSFSSSRYDLIMMNSPFSFVEEFARMGWQHLAYGGTMICLMRTQLLSGQDRSEKFWPNLVPTSVHTLARRPSFSDNGKTGKGDEYMFVTFSKPLAREDETRLQICRKWDYSARDYSLRKGHS